MDNQYNLHFYSGDHFPKNELRSRLQQMDVAFDTNEQRKGYFALAYDQAIRNKSNVEKLKDRLLKDTREFELLKGKSRGREEDNKEYNFNDLIPSRMEKIEPEKSKLL
jgi:hypothetical protein